LVLDKTSIAAGTFNDLPPEEAQKLSPQFLSHSHQSFLDPLTYAGYKDVPVAYLLTEKDLILTPELQQSMIDNVEKELGRQIPVYKYDVGHGPHLSAPDSVLEAISKSLKAFGA
jgi:pimeloyl-ACP methyl ester carboxylesterase